MIRHRKHFLKNKKWYPQGNFGEYRDLKMEDGKWLLSIEKQPVKIWKIWNNREFQLENENASSVKRQLYMILVKKFVTHRFV